MSTQNLYIKIWEDVLPNILDFLTNNNENEIFLLDEARFHCVGNRVKSGYSFRLEIVNGNVPRKNGSAVARDLKEVLDASKEFKNLAIDFYLIIRLDKKFNLYISKWT